MNPTERRATYSLAAIFSLRMLGLFMILPVFALYAEDLIGVTPLMVGVAISAYGLTQALLQIPFGALSDRWGRKSVITFGLILFGIGSIVAAMADSVWGVTLGRALQGSGAVAAAIMALAADLTREEQRTKAMAVIGTTIGVAFVAALVVGPLLAGWIGVRGIFWLTAVLAGLSMVVLWLLVPNPSISTVHRDAEPLISLLNRVVKDHNLLRLDGSIFTLHLILTANFVVLPLLLRDQAGLEAARHWQVYLPVMSLALLLMIPALIYGERRGRLREILRGAIFVLGLAQFGYLLAGGSLVYAVISILLFFIPFMVLEAILPSWVSKVAPPICKGTALGVYATSQFFGAFVGGVIGGWLHGAVGLQGVFGFCAMIAAIWWLSTIRLSNPARLSSRVVHVGELDSGQALQMSQRLGAVAGVLEAVVVADEGAAYLKIDPELISDSELEAVLPRI